MQAFDDLFKVWQDYKDWLRKAIWDLGLTDEAAQEFRQDHPFLSWLTGQDDVPTENGNDDGSKTIVRG